MCQNILILILFSLEIQSFSTVNNNNDAQSFNEKSENTGAINVETSFSITNNSSNFPEIEINKSRIKRQFFGNTFGGIGGCCPFGGMGPINMPICCSPIILAPCCMPVAPLLPPVLPPPMPMLPPQMPILPPTMPFLPMRSSCCACCMPAVRKSA
uniref:Uncharacterized protein n=1 Tax=Meloidogyne hapla TaxID=6305 RepID=A0A1I8BHW3_MELHA